MSLRIAVFASGGGSNLQALLDRFPPAGDPEVALVVSDRADAGALDRARAAGVQTLVLAPGGADSGRVMLDSLRDARIGLVCLAGYLKLIPGDVVAAFRNRILNIHPALLPSFGGKGMYGARVHRAVLDAGCTVSGATVHLVDEEYDRGAILGQWPVPVLRGDTPELLGRRVLRVEHRLYPAIVAAVAPAVARYAGEWRAHAMPDWSDLPPAAEDPAISHAVADPEFELVQGS